jgi:adenylate kinase family enzyme
MGPPGAGKTTLHGEIIMKSEYFGGVQEDAIERWMLQNTGTKYRLPYQIFPHSIRPFLHNEFIEPRLRQTVFYDFIEKYPKFLEILSSIIQNADHEPINLVSGLKQTAENYQLGKSMTNMDETLCLHEGFAQRAISILWRYDNFTHLKKYISSTPTPSLILYIDESTNICLDRQRDRGRIVVSKDWTEDSFKSAQIRVNEICRKVRGAFKNYTATKIVIIENTDNIDYVVNKILYHIKHNC